MRLPLTLIIIPILALLTDYYIYRHNLRNRSWWIKIGWWSLTVCTIILVLIVASSFLFQVGEMDINQVMWSFFIFLGIYIPKGIYTLFSLLGNLPRLWHKSYSPWGDFIGLAFAIYIIVTMLYGAFYARQHPVCTYQTIYSPRLPKAFDGYRIVQFSDLHIETLGSAARYLPQWVAQINALQPDLIVFTGDLVNRQGGELVPHMATLAQLSAADGVYSVLGNHDYGGYNRWNSMKERTDTLRSLINHEKEMNWHLLNNRSVHLHRGNDSIAIIGVENWGEPPYPKHGDLDAAYSTLNNSTYKILLSHNPKHWRAEVLLQSNIDLMLAGHTHAMQFKWGISGCKLSPSQLLYPEWSGLYSEGNQHLYVNEGMGCVGLPMRIGARPEITIITLKQK